MQKVLDVASHKFHILQLACRKLKRGIVETTTRRVDIHNPLIHVVVWDVLSLGD